MHDRDVRHPAVEHVGQDLEVALGRPPEIDLAGRLRRDDQLLHVNVRRVENPAALGDRENGDRVGLALGDEVGALHRIDGDVDVEPAAGADLLPDEQHRGLVPLPLPDHDAAADRQPPQRVAHRRHRGLVGAVVVPLAHVVSGGHRRGFGHGHDVDRERPLHAFPFRAIRRAGHVSAFLPAVRSG